VPGAIQKTRHWPGVAHRINLDLVYIMNRRPEPDHNVTPFFAALTGYIIGSRGNGIKSMEEQSGARIRIETNRVQHYNEDWAYMRATGTRQQIDAARCLLMMRVRDALRGGHARAP